MNIRHYVRNSVTDNKRSALDVEHRQDTEKSVEVTMSDIANKLRYVYAQMQTKKPSCRLMMRHSANDSITSYLDDISRAIVAEHYARSQAQKKIFECLDITKTLIQYLLHERKSFKKPIVTQGAFSAQSPDSVVRHLANMMCEENQKDSSYQEKVNFSKKEKLNPIQREPVNSLQQRNLSSVTTGSMQCLEDSLTEKSLIDGQSSNGLIEVARRALSFKKRH
ncbi:hypothetical protein H704_00936 [Bartonella bacilliformis Peru38]|uniref:hypothetical protein n=1 Tax=Bartonella bacilliformis TaxID=774 RepID=UPI0004A15D4F|nr:hypothetical protein [Bartonella bacilliformis]KEG17084.1 hypothetical protein H705_00977 [Bartonella bacilliformis Cond044]KEG20287.1 hypothetical protein H704_00936 [Bartonella bacilliformis Peru38]